jgi:CPA2 family monovalent cation:H+ antiporter-2
MNISSLLTDLCFITVSGAIFGLVARALKLPTMVGYLAAGFLIGPHSPLGFSAIADTERIRSFAELGMILLIFTVGLDLGFRRLKALGIAPIIIALTESLGLWFLATQLAISFGYSSAVAQFLGAAVAISSTTVILATLQGGGLSTAKFSDLLIGILLVEDLVAILMLVYLPTLAQGSGNLDLLKILFELSMSLFAWWLGGSIIVPKIASAAQRFGGDELLLLASLGLCLGLSVLAVTLDFSAALGAFMMGAILADSRQNRRIEVLVKPLRQTFGILFFVSFGMLFNPFALSAHWHVFAAFLALQVLGKFVITTAVALVAGKPFRDALRAAAFLGLAGEFSFVIIEIGVGYKFLPEEIFPLVVAIAVSTVLITPFFATQITRHAESIEKIIPEPIRNMHQSYCDALKSYQGTRNTISFLGNMLNRRALRWFSEKIAQNYQELTVATTSSTLNRLAPWDEYLSEIHLDGGSYCEGKSILELNTRSTFNVNIVGVERNFTSQIPPAPNLRLLPGDALLVYGAEKEIASFAELCRATSQAKVEKSEWISLLDCDLRALPLSANHAFVGKSLRELNLRNRNSIMVIAVVRGPERIKNPNADFILESNDEIYVVGPREALARMV